jgi:MFS transporter, CP family, cyanate transporter
VTGQGGRDRWRLLALICLLYGSFGLVTASLAPLVAPILHDLHMSRGEMGLVLGSWQFVYLFVAIPAGAILDRFGLRRALLWGISLVAASQLLRAAARDEWTLLGAVMIFGLGGAFVSIGAPKLVSMSFGGREAATALSLYTVSPSIGNILAFATANSVLMPLTGNSWRETLLCFGALPVLAVAAWLFLARDVPAATASSGDASILGSLGDLLRLRVIQLVLVMAVGAFLFVHSLNSWLPEVLRAGGMTASSAGFWATLPTVVGIGTVLVVPRVPPRLLVVAQIATFVSAGIGALLIAFGGSVVLYLGLVLVGVARGAMPAVLMLTLLRSPQIGAALMGAAAGLFFTAGQIGGVSGPALTGAVADATGGFTTGMTLLAGVSFGLAVLSVPLARVAHPTRAEPALAEAPSLMG